MRRALKLLAGLLVVLAVLLVVNAIVLDSQTKQADATVDDSRILELSGGDVQVTDTGTPAAARRGSAGQPVVLLHCYACSLRWYDRLEPFLAGRHRVIRVDLLGFGGSEKPSAGYEIDAQARLVAETLNELGVEGALVVGHSMGGSVAASLAEQASQLVDRAALIGVAPNTRDFGSGLPLQARISYWPVIGQAAWRVTPDFAVRDGYAEAFAPGYDTADGFSDPDQLLADFDAMTYTSYDDARQATDDFLDSAPLDQRFRAAPVPLMVIMGARDQIYDAERSLAGFEDVPGVRLATIEGAGHAPQVERPRQVAALLEEFALDPDDAQAGLPRDVGLNPSGRRTSPNRPGDRPRRARQGSGARRGGG